MNNIKNTFDSVTFFALFLGEYKIWLLICIASICFFGYKFFADRYTEYRSVWLYLFGASILIAVTSNLYFWSGLKAEVKERDSSGALQFPR